LRLGELNDAAIVIESRGALADTAANGSLAETVFEHLDMPHSVQDWQDCRARPDSRCEIVYRSLQRKALHCEQHCVERVPELHRGRQFWRKGRAAMRADDLESTLAKLGCSCRPNQEGSHLDRPGLGALRNSHRSSRRPQREASFNQPFRARTT
jgi:hypothetical protein